MKTYRLREDKSLEETTGDMTAVALAFKANRKVGNTKWPLPDGQTLVLSTVFLVYDHDGDLFETMAHIEGGSFGEGQVRYPTWEKASEAHGGFAKAIGEAIELCETSAYALSVADSCLGAHIRDLRLTP